MPIVKPCNQSDLVFFSLSRKFMLNWLDVSVNRSVVIDVSYTDAGQTKKCFLAS